MPLVLMVGTNVLVISPFLLDLGLIWFGLKKHNEFIIQEGLEGTFVRHLDRSILLRYVKILVSMGRMSFIVHKLLGGR